ncbi:MAG: CYTH domain-containing protein [Candidatus Jorgensenbacteria bacterium]|nr:CYTH domain-containing protein [Candidatus Jorgensenbacteria bacterium]
MKTELEAKFLDIDPVLFRKKLIEVGAILITAERLMKRKVFDFPDERLEKEGAWIRVRDEGDKITVSYKRLLDRSLYGTKEITITADNFDDACNIFLAIGLKQSSYQETRRETWKLNDCEITIDTWPWIPSFVEFEASTEEEVKDGVDKLGFDWSQAMHGSVETAYQKYFNVTEKEIDAWKEITFIPTPDWLEIQRKK